MTVGERLFSGDLLDLCDDRIAPWPDGWQDQFKDKVMFRLVGLEELFAAQRIYNATERMRVLRPHVDTVVANYSERWARYYPGPAYRLDQEAFDPKDWGLQSLGDNTLRNLFGFEAATFPKIALAALAAASLIEDDLKLEGETSDFIEIRYAGYQIVGFKQIYEALTLPEKLDLTYVSAQQAALFEDMAKGVPVTLPLASLTAQLISEQTSVGRSLGDTLRIAQYQTPLQVQQTIASNSGTDENAHASKHEVMIFEPVILNGS